MSAVIDFEVRGDVIFSQSGGDCPVIFCPVHPTPTVSNLRKILQNSRV